MKKKKENGPLSNDLLQVSLPIKSNSTCDSYFQKLNLSFNKDLELCAGIEGWNKDTCQGIYFWINNYIL